MEGKVGVVATGVEPVGNRRMKRQGMRWRRLNASSVVALRVRQFNADWAADDDPITLSAA